MLKFAGVAAFKDDKLAGFLNEKETQGLNWVIGDVKRRVLTMNSMLKDDKLISIEVIRANTQIEPRLEGDNLSFIIHVEEEGALVDQQSVNHLKAKSKKIVDYLRKVEEKNEELIEEEIKLAMAKVQGDIQADILGFGQALQKKSPEKWNEVKEKWEELFPNIDYEVKVTAKIIKTNLKKGTYQSKD
ncbi:Ger(x)C family spore germination C-terminal domain-containing protein [Bacillus taeanensis]|nr:Ger(x)C family spore germination C-terminal domain-containing protein [Bacillus taeanensis]